MVVGVIPARYGSTRFPGKPLQRIGSKPMIVHTYESACSSVFTERVIVATDDARIYKTCDDFGVDVMMTPKDIRTGSDRIAFVAEKTLNADIIVNIQGDEPFIKGRMIDQAIQPLLMDETIPVSTLAKQIERIEELQSPDIVKVVFDMRNNALYFSRSPIPFPRDHRSLEQAVQRIPFYKHIGLYVYRKEALFRFTALPQSDLEKIEKLEQLRMIENSIPIKIVETDFESISVDTPDDLEQALIYYEKFVK